MQSIEELIKTISRRQSTFFEHFMRRQKLENLTTNEKLKKKKKRKRKIKRKYSEWPYKVAQGKHVNRSSLKHQVNDKVT